MLRLIFTLALASSSLAVSSEYEEEPRSLHHVSRRAIDGTRGRKHFDPREDGFFDDYGFDKGQYHGNVEKEDASDIRSNVPGEPGVDYPAFTVIPKTSFSCNLRERGYYADEEAGCQAFHICDDGQKATFLCPIGSLFSQRLLTCDWWTKVPCSQSHEFYNQQLPHQSQENVESIENQASLGDQYEENDRVVLNVVRNENELEQEQIKHRPIIPARGQQRNKFNEDAYGAAKKATDPSSVKHKSLESENKKNKNRGSSSFRLSSSNYYSHRRPHYEASTVSSTTTQLTTEEPRISSISSEVKNHRYETSTAPIQLASQEYQEISNEQTYFDVEVPEKKGIEDNINEKTNLTELEGHNYAYEYDDMEGKESIGLVNSHAERNLEKQREKATSTESSQKNEITTLEIVDSTTLPVDDSVEFTTLSNESFQVKESIGLVQSKVEEKVENYNDEIFNTENPVNEELRNIDEKKDTTEEYSTESSTLLYNDTESSVDVTTLPTFTEEIITEKVKHPKSQEARKMSGFIINFVEKKFTESTTLSPDEISSSDYQKLLNSSNNLFTSKVPVTTESFLEVQTKISTNNNEKVSDAAEESNSPFSVTLTVNDNSMTSKNNVQNPINDEPISQLIPHDENESIDLTNVEMKKFNLTNSESSTNPNEQQASAAVKTYQHYRNYQDELKNKQIYKSQPIISTTYSSYQNNPVEYVTSTAKVPIENTINFHNNQYKQENFNNYQSSKVENQQYLITPQQIPQQAYNNNEGILAKENIKPFQNTNSRNSKSHKFESLNIGNYKEEPFNINHYSSEKSNNFESNLKLPSILKDSKYLNKQPDQPNHNDYRDQLYKMQDLQNYQVNYQTHNYPDSYSQYYSKDKIHENLNDQRLNTDIPHKYVNEPQFTTNYQNTNLPQKHPNQQQLADNSQNNQNNQYYDDSKNFQNQPNINYPDYQNYDSAENLDENLHLGDFGARISAKNQNNNNFFNTDKERSMSAPNTDPHSINSGLQGNNNVKVLYAMSQMLKNNHLPKPFTSNSYGRNIKNHNYQNTVENNDHKQKNHLNQVALDNNYNSHSNNYKDPQQNATKDQQNVNIDNFAAPKLEMIQNGFGNYNFKVYSNGKFEKVQTIFSPNDQLNLRKEKQARIVNVPVKPITTPPVYNAETSQPYTNSFNLPSSTPQIPLELNHNLQSQSISHQEYNDYDYENSQAPDKNVRFPMSSQPESTDYGFQPIQPPIENSQTVNPDYPIQSQPPSFEYNDQPTPQHVIENTGIIYQQHFQPTPNPPMIENTGTQGINIQQNLQPPSFTFQDPIQPSIESTGHIEYLQNLQPPRVDYNSQQTIQGTPENTQVHTEHNQNSFNSQSQPTGYNSFQQSVQTGILNALLLDSLRKLQPPKFTYKAEPTTTKAKIISKNTRFLPTLPPLTERAENQNVTETDSSNTTKSSVETEFIPSLSFDFGSDEGKKEFLVALEKGLLPDDDSKVIDIDASSSASARVENEDSSSSSSSSSNSNTSSKNEKSDAMNNFKDTSDVMSGTE